MKTIGIPSELLSHCAAWLGILSDSLDGYKRLAVSSQELDSIIDQVKSARETKEKLMIIIRESEPEFIQRIEQNAETDHY